MDGIKEKSSGESYNYSDQELIRQLVKSRLSQGQELEYEDLSDYELPPRTQFSMLSKPAVTIKYGKMTFNMAAVRLFEDAYHVLTPSTSKRRRLSVIPCTEEESASVEWARKRKSDGAKVNKTITSDEYTLKLFKMMGWNLNCRYKILGRVTIGMPGNIPILVFDLDEAVMFDSKPMEIVDDETGEIKKKQVKYYPDTYKDCIGKSYVDYMECKQMNMFEMLSDYTGQSYSDLDSEEPKEEEQMTEKQEKQTEESTPVSSENEQHETAVRTTLDYVQEGHVPKDTDGVGTGGGGYYG